MTPASVPPRHAALGVLIIDRDLVFGLRPGVDHWLTKPVAAAALLATIEAAVRPAGTAAGSAVSAGELEVDPGGLTCTVRGRVLRLTVKEFGVLVYLTQRRGRIVSRGEVFADVWGWPMLDGDRTLDVYVRRLRAKLQAASPGWRYIHTHKRRGYRFDAVPLPPDSLESREHRGTWS